MRTYLASPNTQQQAQILIESGLPALLSFALYAPWLDRYVAGFKHLLIDSGAYSAYSSGKVVDVVEYADWMQSWDGRVDGMAGMDDISGDWRLSLANYKHGGFPTIHSSDPPELLDDLIPMAREQGDGWIGIGLTVPRGGKDVWVKETLDRIPEDLKVHGWACRAYTRFTRFDSVDSTNWWRDGMAVAKKLPWINYGEALQLVCLRYQRENRERIAPDDEGQGRLL